MDCKFKLVCEHLRGYVTWIYLQVIAVMYQRSLGTSSFEGAANYRESVADGATPQMVQMSEQEVQHDAS